MTNREINGQLKQLTEQFQRDYSVICENSRNAYMKTLPAGAPMPKEGLIYGKDSMAHFEEKCGQFRDQARSIIAETRERIRTKATEAPSTDAVNSITLLSMRKNITEEEIGDLLDKYGDNPQAYKTINAIANDHDIRAFGDHPIFAESEALDGLASALDKTFSPQSAINGHMSAGFMSLINANIDSVFPTE